MHWRRVIHDWSLIFFASLGAYMISVLLAYQIVPHVVALAGSWQSQTGRIVLSIAVLDLSKAPGLILLAWLIGGAIRLRPWIAAIGLILLIYLLDTIVAVVVGQNPWPFDQPLVLLSRIASVALIWWLVMLIFRRRKTSGAATPKESA
jgi:hypothetical protein